MNWAASLTFGERFLMSSYRPTTRRKTAAAAALTNWGEGSNRMAAKNTAMKAAHTASPPISGVLSRWNLRLDG